MYSIKQGVAAALRPIASSSRVVRHTPRPAAFRATRFASSSSTPFEPAEPVEIGGETTEVPDWPSNVSFEDSDGVVDEGLGALGGARLHESPMAGGEIYLPLSSLASPTPTEAGPNNLAIALPSEVFAKPLRRDILHRCVTWELSLLRQGSGSTKDRSEVRASGRKLYRQKGTGRARVGDAGSGIRRGGGVIHGPRPRDFALSLPRKVHALGLGTAFSSKLNAGLLRVVPDLAEGRWQATRDARKALCHTMEPKAIERFGNPKSISLLLLHSPFKSADEIAELQRVTRNLPGVLLMDVSEAGVWEILKYQWVVMEAEAVDALAAGLGTAWSALQDEGMALAEAEAFAGEQAQALAAAEPATVSV